VDLTKPTEYFPHYWEKCVGSGHALLALRSDWQNSLRQAHYELGFESVRFHAPFDDDMSTLLSIDDSGIPTYSFFNIDQIYDFLLSIGMKPLIELSFMPILIASGNQTVFHYQANITPPKNYADWANLVSAFASHLIERYGEEEVLSWHFETWNEPNCGFWTGDQNDYFQLLNTTYFAIKSVNKKLSVGGPATCESQWLNETIDFTTSNGYNLDFISTHEYPTDPLPFSNTSTSRDSLMYSLRFAREQVGPDTLLFYTEYNSGLYSPGYHDDPFAAAFVIKNVKDVRGLVQIFSYWTFSDVFEEGGLDSVPFHEGFGMMNVNGVPKPVWRAFQLLHQAGDNLVNDSILTTYPEGNYSTVDVLATVDNSSSTLQMLLTNHDVPPHTVTEQNVCLMVQLPAGSQKQRMSTNVVSTLQRIDDNNANAVPCWIAMGSPTYLSTSQVEALHECSGFQTTSVTLEPVTGENDLYFININIPPEGVASLQISL